MAMDRNGNNHEPSGTPKGGQFAPKAGQGVDDDLDFGTEGRVPGAEADARTAQRATEFLKSLPDDARISITVGSGLYRPQVKENVIQESSWGREDIASMLEDAGKEPSDANIDAVLSSNPQGLEDFNDRLTEEGWEVLHDAYDDAIDALPPATGRTPGSRTVDAPTARTAKKASEFLESLPDDARISITVGAPGTVGGEMRRPRIKEGVISESSWGREDIASMLEDAGKDPSDANIETVLASNPRGLEDLNDRLTEEGWEALHDMYDDTIDTLG